MNKKGESTSDFTYKSMLWMGGIFMIALIVGYLMYSLSAYKESLVSVPSEIQAEFVALRFTNVCFTDGLPNRIVLEKFNPETLNKCYFTPEERGFKEFNFRLQLLNEDKVIATNNYYNKDDFSIVKEVQVISTNGVKSDQLFIFVQEI
jgi:hypothetical protein